MIHLKRLLQIIVVTLMFFYNSIEVFSIELQPININYSGVEMKDDTIAIYGDYGSMILSFDNAKSWKQIRVFETGTIVKLFFEADRITTFNDLGKINISTNYGKNWVEMADFQDTVFSVLKLDDGYLVRLDEKLVLLTEQFQFKKETELRPIIPPGFVDGLDYKNRMTKFKGNFIISTFGYKFLVYNQDLNKIDSIRLSIPGLCDTCLFQSLLFSDSENIYIQGAFEIIKSLDIKNFDTIYTSPQKQTPVFNLVDGTLYLWNGTMALAFELYKITTDSLQTIAKYKGIEASYNAKIYQLAHTFDNDRVVVVGKDKLIIIHDIKKDSAKLVSYLVSHSRNLLPDAINDSTFLFYRGYTSTYKNYGVYSPVLFKTNDWGLTFQYSINMKNNPDIWGYSYNDNFNYKYFDDDKNLLYLGGWDTDHHDTGGFIVTGDYGNTFDFIPVPNLGFQAKEVPNLQRKNNHFITSESYSHPMTKKRYTYVFTLDNNFAMVDSFSFYNYIVRHQHSYDANSFLFLSENKLDSINEINYTTDKGRNFEVIKGYSKHDNLLYYHDYKIKGIDYLYMCFYNLQDSVIRFEALNIDDRTVHLVYSTKALADEVDDIIYNTAFYGEGDKFYLAVRDTLFQIDDIYASTHDKFNILPNNGRIKRTLKKFGNTFYVYYRDDKNPLNLYWMNLDSNNTSVEYEAENKNYLYSYPPYPLPAMNEVRSLIYWDTSIEIDVEQISVYNIYGTKVAGHDKIRLDKLNAYSGNLVWDCSGVESGIYVIHLKHGTENRIIKAIVTK